MDNILVERIIMDAMAIRHTELHQELEGTFEFYPGQEALRNRLIWINGIPSMKMTDYIWDEDTGFLRVKAYITCCSDRYASYEPLYSIYEIDQGWVYEDRFECLPGEHVYFEPKWAHITEYPSWSNWDW
jgi:hypothetical protein